MSDLDISEAYRLLSKPHRFVDVENDGRKIRSDFSTSPKAGIGLRKSAGTSKTAIEIGELLTRQKSELNHGEWLPWCRENLEFDARTAQKYIAIYRGKNEVASYLGIEEAYRLLSQPAQP